MNLIGGDIERGSIMIEKGLATIGVCAFLYFLITVPTVGCWAIGATGIVLVTAIAIIWS